MKGQEVEFLPIEQSTSSTKWEKEHPIPEDVQEAAKAYSASVSNGHHFRDLEIGYAAGMLAERERMMNGETILVAEVKVREDAGGYPQVPPIELYDYITETPKAHPGSKVKVIILK